MFTYNKFILQGGFFLSFQYFCCIQRNPSYIISKHLGRKDFQWSSFQLIPVSYYVNNRILFQLVNKSLVCSLIAIKRKILASIVVYIFRLFTWLFFLSLFSWIKVKKAPLQWINCRKIQIIMKLNTFLVLETGLNS